MGIARDEPEGEFARIHELADLIGVSNDPSVVKGIGDDAAVVNVDGLLSLSVDAHVEGVHFRRDWCTLEQIGFRSLVAAASDLAAMLARPRYVLSALNWPGAPSKEDFAALVRGQKRAADELGFAIVGGNLSRGRELTITTTVVGFHAAPPVLRSGAKPRETLYLLGSLGEARLGLALLQSGRDEAQFGRFLDAYRVPENQLRHVEALENRVSACIDVSDGLAQDAGHLAEASGVRIVLDEDALRRQCDEPFASTARLVGVDVLEAQLAGGDDFALLFTAPTSPGIGVPIGYVEAGEGLWLESPSRSQRRPVAAAGFDHFGAKP